MWEEQLVDPQIDYIKNFWQNGPFKCKILFEIKNFKRGFNIQKGIISYVPDR